MLIAVLIACEGKPADTPAVADSGTNPVDTAGGTGSATPTDTGSTPLGDGNDTLAEADSIQVDGRPTVAELDPVESDVDWYVFTTYEGRALYLYADAKPAGDPFGTAWPDLVLTVYDRDGVQLAQGDLGLDGSGDNPWFYTVAGYDGSYYLSVQDRCTSALVTEPCPAAYYDAITDPGYTLGVRNLIESEVGNVEEAEPNDTPAQATAMEYAPLDGYPGYYLESVVWGYMGADADWYLLEVPDDLRLTTSPQAVLEGFAYPGGPSADGATAEVGSISILDATTLSVLARIEGVVPGQMVVPPIDVLTDYFLVVEAPEGVDLGMNPFYLLDHWVVGIRGLAEAESGTGANDEPASAEELETESDGDGGWVAWFHGELVPAEGDMDAFAFAMPESGLEVDVGCSAWRYGSGLRDFAVEVLDADGVTTLATSAVETVEADVVLEDVPAGDLVYVRVHAGWQDPEVAGAYYYCGVLATPPEQAPVRSPIPPRTR